MKDKKALTIFLFFFIYCQLCDGYVLKMKNNHHFLNVYYLVDAFYPLSYQSYSSPTKKVLLALLYIVRKWRLGDSKPSSQVP